jgi:hypothetical protein
MQRKVVVALVAGGTVGIGGGGALGAFLACTAGRAAARRFLDLFSDQYIDLSQLAPPTVRHSAQQASLSRASVTTSASDQSLPNVGAAPAAAPAP